MQARSDENLGVEGGVEIQVPTTNNLQNLRIKLGEQVKENIEKIKERGKEYLKRILDMLGLE